MEKKKILVACPYLPPFEEYTEEIKSIWEAKWLTNFGSEHQRLEGELKKKLDVNNLSLFVNGHSALELALEALELEGEVITTPFTFVSTTHSIVRQGLAPVFCDIEPETYTIDPEKIESLITPKTSAIVPVHVYGNLCNMQKIDEIAKKYGLKVIYDAAHAVGVKYKGRGIGGFGDISMFSFHATKVFNTIEGGALAYNDGTLYEKLLALCQFGISGRDKVDSIGTNAKMNEFQAAMGLCNLRHLDECIQKRKSLFERYDSRLRGVRGIKLRNENPDISYNYSYYYVEFTEEFFKSRDEIKEQLNRENIFPRKYFYPLTSDLGCYAGRFDSTKTPVAKAAANHILTLPMHTELQFEDVDRICDIILKR